MRACDAGYPASMVFQGVGVALVTLFDGTGAVDAPATAAHAARLVEAGIRAVVVAGTTGEAAALTGGERDALLSAVRGSVDGAVPVIAGTGAPSIWQAQEQTERARDAGADAALVLSPAQTADPRPYYEAVAKVAGDMPVLAYHFPTVAPPGIPVEVIDDLPVSGCKDSSGDAERLLATLEATAVPLYTGSSALLGLAGPAGCAGAILALANLRPEECIAAFAGDLGAQRALIGDHLAMRARFPRGLKSLMAERLSTSDVARIG
ncbi:MAG TPA: dihydrodipicolinate synthase family protein [Euzebyales bacterium]|nr:dihydrodipicolinate synthase family protein [Euzebyales bacterium]